MVIENVFCLAAYASEQTSHIENLQHTGCRPRPHPMLFANPSMYIYICSEGYLPGLVEMCLVDITEVDIIHCAYGRVCVMVIESHYINISCSDC
jgi:hypothetical protein